MNTQKSRRLFDIPVSIMVTALVLFGIIMIGSAGGWVYDSRHISLSRLMVRQLIGFVLGCGIVYLIWICPYRFFKALAIPFYLAVLVLLLMVLRFGEGAEAGDNVRRWLPLFTDITIQPSEFAKIALILCLAWYFERFSGKLYHPLVILGAALVSLLPLYLVYREPDLSTSLVILAVVFACFFAAKVHWAYILAAVLLFAGGLYLILHDALSEAPRILSPYQAERILAWLHPEDYALTAAYQSIQSRTAIGAGGLIGKGLFHNSGMVPIATTDFIFGVIGEELGFVGGALVIVWYFLLSIRMLRFGFHTENVFGRVICVGSAVMIAFQALVHIGVTIAVLPNTGLPLPFVSYGLSSLTANIAAIGLVLRMEGENRRYRKRR